MVHQKVVCIDFGSSYTKVAVRRDWDASAEVIRSTQLSLSDVGLEFCIPSVAAKSRSGEWLFGAGAAQLPKSDAVHQNWKARLFPLRGDVDSEARTMAVSFFRAIRTELVSKRLGHLPCRLCIPAIGTGRKSFFGELLSEAGFLPAQTNPVVYEPESNAFGVLSRAQNSTHFPNGNARYPCVRSMLDKQVVAVIAGMGAFYRALLVDIGAFTTDLAYVQIDTDLEDKRPSIVQESKPLGVGSLDEMVIGSLPTAMRDAIGAASTVEFEYLKRALYKGEAGVLRRLTGGTMAIGAGAESRTISEMIRLYSGRVAQAIATFTQRCVHPARLHVAIVTGGGVAIPSVRQAVSDCLRQQFPDVRVIDLMDRATANVLPKIFVNGIPTENRRAVDQRHLENQELIRTGSAVGGCSVLFEMAAEAEMVR